VGERIVLSMVALSGLYPLAYYGERWFGLSQDTATVLYIACDIWVVLMRFSFFFGMVHRDVLVVAQEAIESQEFEREASDSRLDAIKQFTRYIFHEARVPLQAVALSVQELQESIKDISSKSRRLSRSAPPRRGRNRS